MIYTSYFGKVKELDLGLYTPIAICGKAVDGWQFPQYKRLAPSWSIYSEYKLHGGTEERYIERYKAEILGKLSIDKVVDDLYSMTADGTDPVLICYEKPGDFCHRHLVAEWLGKDLCAGELLKPLYLIIKR